MVLIFGIESKFMLVGGLELIRDSFGEFFRIFGVDGVCFNGEIFFKLVK